MTASHLSARLLVGLFVGGKGSRMGGVAKGLLKAPGSSLSLVERLLEEVRSALPAAPTVLVGEADAYAHLALPCIADQPPQIGPLGGLSALLLHAQSGGLPSAVAIACDLPHVTAELIARVAFHAPDAKAVVACHGGIRNPFFARYETAAGLDAARATVATGKRSLQAVLDRLASGVTELPLSASEAALLGDWDTPADVAHQKPTPP